MARRTEKAKATKNNFIEKEVSVKGYDLKISLAKANEKSYPCIAYGEIIIPDLFYMKIRVIEKKDGDDIFVSFPQNRVGYTWKTQAAPINSEIYEAVTNTAAEIVDKLYNS